MNSNSRDYLYTKCVFKYIVKNNFLITAFYVIDFMCIYAFITLSPRKFENLNKIYNEEDSEIFYISPYNYYKKYIPTDDDIYMMSVVICVILILIIYYLLLLILTKDFVNKSSNNSQLFIKIYVNFYEVIIFRLLTLYILDSLVTTLIKCIYKTYEKDDATYPILIILILFAIMFFLHDNIERFQKHAVIANLKAYPDTLGNYPFDLNFSNNYDIVTLIIKIFIVIERNVLRSTNYLISYRIIFLNIIPLAIIILYCFYILMLFYVNTHELLYFPLKKTSIIRNCLIVFAVVSCLYNAVINSKKIFYFFFIDILTLFFILFSFLSHDETTVLNTFYKSNNYIGMLTFLISNDLDYNQIISKWIISHKIICKIQKCPICKNIVDSFGKIVPSNVDIQKFFSFIVEIIEDEIKKENLKLTQQEEIYLDIIKLYNMKFRNETQRLKYYLASYQCLMKYQQSNQTIYYNILIMFEKNMEENEDFNKTYAGFKDSEDVFTLYNTFLDEIDNFMRYQNKNPGNIIKISNKLFKFAKDKKILKLIKNSSSMTYENLILRFIFENICVRSMTDGYEFLDLTNYDDYLEYHFKNDNFLLIHYGLVAKDCMIIKSSADFRKYLNYCLDMLFPSKLRNFGKEKFITNINTNNFKDDLNVFEYIVTNLKNEGSGFIESFYMKYVMFPSVDSGEVLVSGHFLLGNKEPIIFQKVEGNQEILLSFSNNFGEIFCIDVEIVSNLSMAKKFFTLEKLFKKIDDSKDKKKENLSPLEKKRAFLKRQQGGRTQQLMEIDTDSYNALTLEQQRARDREIKENKQKLLEENSEIVAHLDYKYYYSTLKEYLLDNNDVKNKDKLLEKLKDKYKYIKSLEFVLTKKYEINNDDEIYSVYYALIHKSGQEDINNIEKEKERKKFEKNNKDGINEDSFSYIIGDNNSSTGSSTGHTSVTQRQVISGREKLKLEEKVDFEKLNIFYRINHVLNFIILILSGVFLILLLINDHNFNRLFNLYQSFRYFTRGVQTEVMRLISNICLVINEGSNECTNYFIEYAKDLNSTLELTNIEGFDMLISTLIYLQFRDNYENINNHYSSFRKSIFTLSDSYIKEIEKEKIFFSSYSVETENETLVLNDKSFFLKEETFFEGINIFLNFISQVIDTNTLQTTPIIFFSILENYKITLNFSTLTQNQRNIYNVIINYPFVERGFFNVKELIKNWFVGYLNSISQILTIFSIIIIILHIILIVVMVFFLYEFILILNRKLESIKENLGSPSFMKYFKSKFLNLKILLKLYEKTPMEVINIINREKDDYIKIKFIEKKEEIILPEKILKKRKNENLKSFKPLFLYNVFILGFIYIWYFIIAIVLYILMRSKLSTLRILVDYVNEMAEIDNDLSITLNSLQIMITANFSEYDLGYFIKSDKSYGLISLSIRDHLYLMKLSKAIELEHESTYKEISKFDNIGCKDLQTFHDTEFNAIIPEGKTEEYYNYLISLCNSYGVLEYQNQDLVMNNIIYLEEKLLSNIEKKPYESKLNQINIKELYELYSMHLIIMRIIRSYLNETSLPKLINQILNVHKKTFVICLCINFVIEIIVIILLICLISKKLLIINTKVGLFNYFLD